MPKNPAAEGRSHQSMTVARDQLAEAAAIAHTSGVPIPWDLTAHRAGCSLCRELTAADLADLEAQYLAWVPLRALADQYHEAAGLTHGSAREAIRRHGAAFLMDLRRLGDLGTAYSRIVEAGIAAADEPGGATVRDALDALRELAHVRRADRDYQLGAPAGDDRGGRAGGDELPGGVVLTYEARIRSIRAGEGLARLPAPGLEPGPAPAGGGVAPGEVDRSTLSTSESPAPTPPPVRKRRSGKRAGSQVEQESQMGPKVEESRMGPIDRDASSVALQDLSKRLDPNGRLRELSERMAAEVTESEEWGTF